jgi:hypothetical protein
MKRTILLAVVFIASASAQVHALCASSGCPSSTSSFRRLTIIDSLYNESNSHEIWLGEWISGLAIACWRPVTGGTYTCSLLVDQQTGSAFSNLAARSYFCAGAGNDVVRVLTGAQSFVPDGISVNTMYAFPFAGYDLDVLGNSGNDTLGGVALPLQSSCGSGVGNVSLCGGDGNDTLVWFGLAADGWTGHDAIVNTCGGFGADAYGYSGCDRTSNINHQDTATMVDGEGNNDCIEVDSFFPTQYASWSCGAGSDDRSPHYAQAANNCESYISRCNGSAARLFWCDVD